MPLQTQAVELMVSHFELVFSRWIAEDAALEGAASPANTRPSQAESTSTPPADAQSEVPVNDAESSTGGSPDSPVPLDSPGSTDVVMRRNLQRSRRTAAGMVEVKDGALRGASFSSDGKSEFTLRGSLDGMPDSFDIEGINFDIPTPIKEETTLDVETEIGVAPNAAPLSSPLQAEQQEHLGVPERDYSDLSDTDGSELDRPPSISPPATPICSSLQSLDLADESEQQVFLV